MNDKMKEEVKMYMANEWELDHETPEYVLLKKNTSSFLGHLLVFLLTFWFTIGIGNLIYHLASRKKKKLIK